MAAIAHPSPRRHPHPAGQRHLRVVPPPRPLARRRPTSRSAIYWRRRVVVLVALAVLVLAARAALGALGGGPLAAPETPAARGGAGAVYVVQPGDTWWTIARSIQPSGDVRALVDHLAARHGSTPLQPGERLALD